MPIYLEHRANLALLRQLPSGTVDWSLLCPATMTPESPSIDVPAASSRGRLIAGADTPPLWRDSWIKHVPLIGKVLVCAMNGMRYETTLEQNAEFLAEDLESVESRWTGKAVGIVDPRK